MPGLTQNELSGPVASRDFQSSLDEISLGIQGGRVLSVDQVKRSEARLAPLVRTIEAEIFPRLMLAHSGHVPAPRCPAILKKPSSEEVSALARLVLEHDASRATELVESLYCGGMTQEAVYLDLLGPTARYLGEMWEADLCDFIEVTIGLNRLHQVLRRLSRFVQPPEQACSCEPKIDRRILLALAPGEQHSFGLSMVEEIFRCAGWDVCGGLMSSKQNLPSLVNQEWFDAAGISAGSECRLDALTNCICAIRAESLNQRIGILVGGPFFIGHPELVSVVGADSTAGDAWQAVSEAEHLVALRR